MLQNKRLIYFIALLVSFSLLITSFVVQFQFNQEPCPLCILDRFWLFLLILVFSCATCYAPKLSWHYCYAAIVTVITSLGIATTLRHLWLIGLPADEVPDCGPSLGYLIKNLPMHSVIREIITGSGQCAEDSFLLLGLPLPGWALIGFIVILCLSFTLWWGLIKKG